MTENHIKGRDKYKKYKFVFKATVYLINFFPKSIKIFLLKFFRNVHGYFGLFIRFVLVKSLAERCGDNVAIHPGVFIFNVDKISFGSNVSIHPMCYIEGAGTIEIGDEVSIAHSTSILTTNHVWQDGELPIKYNPVVYSGVNIGSDVWVGCGVRILAGVKINDRSIVAAGAVVNKDVASNTVVGGVPAKPIKQI